MCCKRQFKWEQTTYTLKLLGIGNTFLNFEILFDFKYLEMTKGDIHLLSFYYLKEHVCSFKITHLLYIRLYTQTRIHEKFFF